eukprot:653487-Pelagomonas_calceolata.AAC.1
MRDYASVHATSGQQPIQGIVPVWRVRIVPVDCANVQCKGLNEDCDRVQREDCASVCSMRTVPVCSVRTVQQEDWQPLAR